jgi:spore maturation protein CgeB
MRVFAFGSSITSSYWNGAATYYRGIYKQLHALGHQVTFAEPDAYGRQQKRDAGDFSYVNNIVYKSAEDVPALLTQAAQCDLVIKHSGVGVFDELWKKVLSAAQKIPGRPSGTWMRPPLAGGSDSGSVSQTYPRI